MVLPRKGWFIMADDLYRKFTRERLYEQVADHIEDLVSTGKLQVDDRLPPERDLAEKLGVARGVVREAVKVLDARGLVRVEPGRGTFVTEGSAESISEHVSRLFRMGRLTYEDLIEVRKVLEVEIAYFAAGRADLDNLEMMRQAIEQMDQRLDNPEEYIEADLSFHLALARATQNGMFLLLIEVIVDFLQKSRRLIFQVPGAPQRGQVWHRRILQAVEEGDPDAAADAMRNHMQQVAKDAAAGQQVQSAKILAAETST
jgi:GntR family transcriptional repressor for pyruvate dehydrogenase complex